MTFSLLEKNPNFSLEPYFEGLITEFEAIGMAVSIKEKKKTLQSNIESAFLKPETVWKELVLEDIIKQVGVSVPPNLRIKIEVDLKPPLGFATEEKLLLRPFSFYVKCFTLPNLFAEKMHALLFRNWKKRVKGRDWYDLEWYIKKGIPLSLRHFLLRAKDSGHWQDNTITEEQVRALLKKTIESVSFNNIREDIIRFIQNDAVLNIWSSKYFTDLVSKMKFDKTK